MRGLRVRSGNIQLGNDDVLKDLFKEPRGNYYFVGEVFAASKELIPNSQRDYFNENKMRVLFEDLLREYFFDVLHKLYYEANRVKNDYKRQEEYIAKVAEEFFMNRDYIGKHWNRKFIRAVQAVLNSTKGKIGRGVDFFEEAFGRDVDEFMKILWMPETFIIYRRIYDADLRARLAERYTTVTAHDCNLTSEWWEKFSALSPEKLEQAKAIIALNKFKDGDYECDDKEICNVLAYYKITRDDTENN